GRDQWEINAVLITWAAAALHAFARPERAGRREQFAVGAVVFGGLPLLDLATGGRFDGLHAGFTFALVAFAALFAFGARKLAGPAAACAGSHSPSTTPPCWPSRWAWNFTVARSAAACRRPSGGARGSASAARGSCSP